MTDRDVANTALERVWRVYRLIDLHVDMTSGGPLSTVFCSFLKQRDQFGRRLRCTTRDKVEQLVSLRVAGGIITKLEEITLKKVLMIGALAFAASTVAQTAMAAEYYVVRDSTTKKCTVVETKPTSTTTTVVDNGIYKTKTEAETGMKSTKVCTE
jgi:hypothetical protein